MLSRYQWSLIDGEGVVVNMLLRYSWSIIDIDTDIHELSISAVNQTVSTQHDN